MIALVFAVHIDTPGLRAMTLQAVDSLQCPEPRNLIFVGQGAEGLGVGSAFPPQPSVSASWNVGIRAALRMSPEFIFVCNNDIIARPDCLSRMIDYGRNHPDVDVLCAREITGMLAGHLDFALFAIRPGTVDLYGYFDENLAPAYREDSDYLARVVLNGGRAETVRDAKFFHYQGVTTGRVNDLRGRPLQWDNEAYFGRKWGTINIRHSPLYIRATHYRTPFDERRTKPDLK